jgi:capsular exopolysaccharide synthesis family protein
MDVVTFLNVLRRRYAVVVACAVIAAGVALGVSLAQPDRYEASADLLFAKDDLDRTLFGSTAEPSRDEPERVAATNLEIASLDVIARSVRRRLGTPLSVEQLEDRIDVEPKGQADIVSITARAPTPERAAVIANAFADEVVSFRRRADQAKVQRAIDALQSGSRGGRRARRSALASGVVPARRLEQLRALKAVQTGDVTVVQRAVPPRHRSSPRPLRNALIGGFLGLVLGVLASLLMNRLDRRIRDDDEAVQLVGAPVLARVPVSRSSRSARYQVVEALQFLRANLELQDPRRERRVLAITSPAARDGKTAITAGLARALALSGHSVIAVDCDLRKPNLHEHLGTGRGDGLTNALFGAATPEELLQEPQPGLRVLSAGDAALDPSMIVLALRRLPEVLDDLREAADYVLVDTPPVSAAADASTVAAAADGVLLVVDRGSARRDRLAATRDQLARANAAVLGIVLNRAPAPWFGAEYGDYRTGMGISAEGIGPPSKTRP